MYNESGIYPFPQLLKDKNFILFLKITYFLGWGDLKFVQLITVAHTCTPSICTNQPRLRS